MKITEYNKKYNTPAVKSSDTVSKKTKAAQVLFDWITSVVIAVVLAAGIIVAVVFSKKKKAKK